MLRHVLKVAVAFVTCLIGASAAGLWDFFGNMLPAEPPAPVIRQESAPECSTSPLTAEQEVAEREILELLRQYDVAETNHDASFFERVEADGFVLTREEGETLTKGQAIAEMKTWDKGVRFSTEDVRVQFYGEAAIVTSRRTETYPGGEPQYAGSWLDVFQKRGGRWQITSTTLVD